MGDRSCYDCIHLKGEYSGDGWNEPMYFEAECNYMDSKNPRVEELVYDIMDDDDLNRADECPLFDAGKCDICGAKLRRQLPYYTGMMYEDYKSCSLKCLEKANEIAKKEYEEWKKDAIL